MHKLQLSPDNLANSRARVEYRSYAKHSQEAVVGDGVQPRRGVASALRTIRSAAELAWHDAALKICSVIDSGSREDTLLGRLRRMPECIQHQPRHIDLWKSLFQNT